MSLPVGDFLPRRLAPGAGESNSLYKFRSGLGVCLSQSCPVKAPTNATSATEPFVGLSGIVIGTTPEFRIAILELFGGLQGDDRPYFGRTAADASGERGGSASVEKPTWLSRSATSPPELGRSSSVSLDDTAALGFSGTIVSGDPWDKGVVG